jgi:hypothetical protein
VDPLRSSGGYAFYVLRSAGLYRRGRKESRGKGGAGLTPAPSSADLHRPSLHHAGGGLRPHRLRAHHQQGAGRRRSRRHRARTKEHAKIGRRKKAMAPLFTFGDVAEARPATRSGLHVQVRHRTDDGAVAKTLGQEATSRWWTTQMAGGHKTLSRRRSEKPDAVGESIARRRRADDPTSRTEPGSRSATRRLSMRSHASPCMRCQRRECTHANEMLASC